MSAWFFAVACLIPSFAVPLSWADEPLRSAELPGRTRSPLYGTAAVSSGQPVATRIGIDVLRSGGNAADAAVAMAAALSVLEPMLGGPGGDVSILYWDQTSKKLYGLDSRGAIPADLFTPDAKPAAAKPAEAKPADTDSAVPPAGDAAVADAEKPPQPLTVAPAKGALSWTTPGAVDGWAELHERFGTKHWEELLQPSVKLATDGFPVAPATAREWTLHGDRLSGPARSLFLHDGRTPAAGEVFRNPDLGRTLQAIAAGGRAVFYEGEIGQTLVAFGKGLDGKLSVDDLAKHNSVWVTPLGIDYREHSVQTLPTSRSGVSALEALGILGSFDLAGMGRTSAQYWHLLIEAKKGAAGDAKLEAKLDLEKRLSAEWLAERRRAIDPNKASAETAGCELQQEPRASTALVVDASGNACVLVQDLGDRFGSGIVPGALGFVVQNRAAGATPESKKPRTHGRLPLVVLHDGVPAAFAAVGAKGAAVELTMQVLTSLIDFHADAQSAVDLPRVLQIVAATGEGQIRIEPGITSTVREELGKRGHVAETPNDASQAIGGDVHLIQRIPVEDGLQHADLSIGSDPRYDAAAGSY